MTMNRRGKLPSFCTFNGFALNEIEVVGSIQNAWFETTEQSLQVPMPHVKGVFWKVVAHLFSVHKSLVIWHRPRPSNNHAHPKLHSILTPYSTLVHSNHVHLKQGYRGVKRCPKIVLGNQCWQWNSLIAILAKFSLLYLCFQKFF